LTCSRLESSIPIRLDFFGDEIESIRTFDPHNQRSIERLNRISLLPSSELPVWRFPEVADSIARLDRSTLRGEVATEWEHRLELMRSGSMTDSVDLFAGYLVPEKTHLLDYLPQDAVVLMDQPDAVERAARQVESQARDLNRTFRDSGELPRGLLTPFVPAARVIESVRDRAQFLFGASASDEPAALSVEAVGDARCSPEMSAR
jgi:transcription-repair coupling factor (superfamily II helicase)